ncbi:hypothetical protein SLOPH_553 [Spraguea lophii 42_110]|uniref:Uncharacterized protein n=1 Tax=Spraguea lophii (strain 42_110) TaxID=1358809 RepID=S7XG46_SPRLO|nr:hypothetical protein SLOPH_553 [Spraguea lophii 42_110]
MKNENLFSQIDANYTLIKRPDGKYEASNINGRILVLSDEIHYSYASIASYLDGTSDSIPLNAIEKVPLSTLYKREYNPHVPTPTEESTKEKGSDFPSFYKPNGSKDLFPDAEVHENFFQVNPPQDIQPSPNYFDPNKQEDDENKGTPPGAKFIPFGPNKRSGDPDPDNLSKPNGNNNETF